MDDKIPSTLEPQNQEPVSPSVSNTPPPQSPNSVQPVVVPGTVTTSAPTGETLPKKQKHWLRLSIIGLITVVVIGFGVTLAVNQDFRATVFRQKFESYTYTDNKGAEYSLLFYRNSTKGRDSYSSGQATPFSYLIAPNKDNGGYPLEISMGKVLLPSNLSQTAKQDINELVNCTQEGSSIRKVKVAFTVYIQSVGITANICAIYAPPNKQNPSFYNSIFENTNGSEVYVIEFQQELNHISAKTAYKSAEEVHGNLNLNVYQGDIKKILGSFRPLST